MANKVDDTDKVKDTIYWMHPTGSHPGMSGLPMPEEQDKHTKSTSKSLNDIEELCDVFEGSMKIDVIKFQQHGNV